MTKATKADGSDCRGTRIRCQSAEGGEHFVCYEPEVVIAMVDLFAKPKPVVSKRVYLTCPLGHAYDYWVKGD